MGEVHEILLNLCALREKFHINNKKNKLRQRQNAIIRWLRGQNEDYKRLVMRIPGKLKSVSDFFGILQFVLVMNNRPMERVSLTWDPHGRPLIPKEASRQLDPESHEFNRANRDLIAMSNVIWDSASPEELIICPHQDIVPLLMILSRGCCFTRMPKDFENLNDIVWLRLSYKFTLGQYLAGV